MQCNKDLYYLVLLFVFLCLSSIGCRSELNKETHKTPGAIMQKNELSCYVCDTLEDGDKCYNITAASKSHLLNKCQADKRQCMVKRYSYTIGTENSTSLMRIWSIQRNCTTKCESGCIVIGERTKLYSCVTCCSKTGCNDGTGAAGPSGPGLHGLLAPLLLLLLPL